MPAADDKIAQAVMHELSYPWKLRLRERVIQFILQATSLRALLPLQAALKC